MTRQAEVNSKMRHAIKIARAAASPGALGTCFGDAMRRAKLTGSLHGLRRYAATNMSAQGHSSREQLLDEWSFWANGAQLPPDGDWRFWLIMGGRGSGKTRAGAEWLRAQAESGRRGRFALVGPTYADVRNVMIEGESGLLAIAPKDQRPVFESSRGRLVWPNGAQAFAFSAESLEGLRGPQFHAAWCDEFCVWKNGETVLSTLDMALRLGNAPRAVITTTPRTNRAMRALLQSPDLALTQIARLPWCFDLARETGA